MQPKQLSAALAPSLLDSDGNLLYHCCHCAVPVTLPCEPSGSCTPRKLSVPLNCQFLSPFNHALFLLCAPFPVMCETVGKRRTPAVGVGAGSGQGHWFGIGVRLPWRSRRRKVSGVIRAPRLVIASMSTGRRVRLESDLCGNWQWAVSKLLGSVDRVDHIPPPNPGSLSRHFNR